MKQSQNAEITNGRATERRVEKEILIRLAAFLSYRFCLARFTINFTIYPLVPHSTTAIRVADVRTRFVDVRPTRGDVLVCSIFVQHLTSGQWPSVRVCEWLSVCVCLCLVRKLIGRIQILHFYLLFIIVSTPQMRRQIFNCQMHTNGPENEINWWGNGFFWGSEFTALWCWGYVDGRVTDWHFGIACRDWIENPNTVIMIFVKWLECHNDCQRCFAFNVHSGTRQNGKSCHLSDTSLATPRFDSLLLWVRSFGVDLRRSAILASPLLKREIVFPIRASRRLSLTRSLRESDHSASAYTDLASPSAKREIRKVRLLITMAISSQHVNFLNIFRVELDLRSIYRQLLPILFAPRWES